MTRRERAHLEATIGGLLGKLASHGAVVWDRGLWSVHVGDGDYLLSVLRRLRRERWYRTRRKGV